MVTIIMNKNKDLMLNEALSSVSGKSLDLQILIFKTIYVFSFKL